MVKAILEKLDVWRYFVVKTNWYRIREKSQIGRENIRTRKTNVDLTEEKQKSKVLCEQRKKLGECDR